MSVAEWLAEMGMEEYEVGQVIGHRACQCAEATDQSAYPLCFAALSALCGAWHLYRDAAHALCSNSIHVTNSHAIDLVVWVRVPVA